MSNLQFYRLKSRRKNASEVILNLSSNVIGDSNDENNFPHNLLLTYKQVSRLREAFTNNSYKINIKFSKTQLSKMVHLGGFLKSFKLVTVPLVKAGEFAGKLIKNLDLNRLKFKPFFQMKDPFFLRKKLYQIWVQE